ncbi:MAG TPA: glycosyltransferase family 2 protein [Candidatus Saccharimonadales bacterium]|nr:glycosyltransferase family 2 protein [Candidatus Saccharimonadales bacterium]
MVNVYPKISIITATLNAVLVLEKCYKSLSEQDYPKEKIELLIGDGGSTDGTLEVAKKYGAKVFSNPLKTAEAGKVVALREATGDFIILIDSDNILPDKNWLKQMIEPLIEHPEAVGSEPRTYTWRKEDGFITRYCALIGMNDPIVSFLGNYDRLNLLTGMWTEIQHDEKDFPNYILATFDQRGMPTIGANGTVFRSDFLKSRVVGDYLFDIDILAKEIKTNKTVRFIKTKNGIIHSYCENDIAKFARKQRRRVKDYLYHQSQKARSVDSPFLKKTGMLTFIIYCVTILPLVYQSIKGYIIKKDTAWFFHPLACEITLVEYSFGILESKINNAEVSRENWKQ